MHTERQVQREKETERERDTHTHTMKLVGTHFQLFTASVPKIGNDKTQILLIIQLPPTYAISNKKVLTRKKARETLQ
jgi:hypothetical protein